MKKTIIFLLTLFLVTGCGCRKKEVEIRNETPSEEVSEIGVSDVKLVNEDGEERIELEIENKTEELKYVASVNITFFDKNEEELEKVTIKVSETIGIGDKRIIQAKIKTDKEKIVSYKYEIVR